MATRVNGGVFDDDVVTGSLRHFVITGANFSGAQDSLGRPIHGSAAEMVFNEITRRATIIIMNPVSQTNRGMSFAMDLNRADWTAEELQTMINNLGNSVGVDGVDLTTVLVHEVPYDFTIGKSMKFIDLIDTPSEYPSGSSGKALAVSFTEDGVQFVDSANDYTDLTSSGSVEIANRYFIKGNITVTLPDITGLEIGDLVIFTKDIDNTATIQTYAPSQLIYTDIGNDTSINYNATEELIFVIDGDGWSLQVGSM